jgi:hypothetical protein
MSDNITYRKIKEPNLSEYWVAERDGKQIAKSNSEQGVRSMVLVMNQRATQKSAADEQAKAKKPGTGNMYKK